MAAAGNGDTSAWWVFSGWLRVLFEDATSPLSKAQTAIYNATRCIKFHATPEDVGKWVAKARALAKQCHNSLAGNSKKLAMGPEEELEWRRVRIDVHRLQAQLETSNEQQIQEMKRALTLCDEGLTTQTNDHKLLVQKSMCLHGLGLFHHKAGLLLPAEQYYRDALKLKQAHLPDDFEKIASSLDGLAGVLMEKRDFDKAVALRTQALQIVQRHHPGGGPDTAFQLLNLSNVHYRRGDEMLARELRDNALSIMETHPRCTDADRARFLSLLNRPPEAKSVLPADNDGHSRLRVLIQEFIASRKAQDFMSVKVLQSIAYHLHLHPKARSSSVDPVLGTILSPVPVFKRAVEVASGMGSASRSCVMARFVLATYHEQQNHLDRAATVLLECVAIDRQIIRNEDGVAPSLHDLCDHRKLLQRLAAIWEKQRQAQKCMDMYLEEAKLWRQHDNPMAALYYCDRSLHYARHSAPANVPLACTTGAHDATPSPETTEENALSLFAAILDCKKVPALHCPIWASRIVSKMSAGTAELGAAIMARSPPRSGAKPTTPTLASSDRDAHHPLVHRLENLKSSAILLRFQEHDALVEAATLGMFESPPKVPSFQSMRDQVRSFVMEYHSALDCCYSAHLHRRQCPPLAVWGSKSTTFPTFDSTEEVKKHDEPGFFLLEEDFAFTDGKAALHFVRSMADKGVLARAAAESGGGGGGNRRRVRAWTLAQTATTSAVANEPANADGLMLELLSSEEAKNTWFESEVERRIESAVWIKCLRGPAQNGGRYHEGLPKMAGSESDGEQRCCEDTQDVVRNAIEELSKGKRGPQTEAVARRVQRDLEFALRRAHARFHSQDGEAVRNVRLAFLKTTQGHLRRGKKGCAWAANVRDLGNAQKHLRVLGVRSESRVQEAAHGLFRFCDWSVFLDAPILAIHWWHLRALEELAGNTDTELQATLELLEKHGWLERFRGGLRVAWRKLALNPDLLGSDLKSASIVAQELDEALSLHCPAVPRGQGWVAVARFVRHNSVAATLQQANGSVGEGQRHTDLHSLFEGLADFQQWIDAVVPLQQKPLPTREPLVAVLRSVRGWQDLGPAALALKDDVVNLSRSFESTLNDAPALMKALADHVLAIVNDVRSSATEHVRRCSKTLASLVQHSLWQVYHLAEYLWNLLRNKALSRNGATAFEAADPAADCERARGATKGALFEPKSQFSKCFGVPRQKLERAALQLCLPTGILDAWYDFQALSKDGSPSSAKFLRRCVVFSKHHGEVDFSVREGVLRAHVPDIPQGQALDVVAVLRAAMQSVSRLCREIGSWPCARPTDRKEKADKHFREKQYDVALRLYKSALSGPLGGKLDMRVKLLSNCAICEFKCHNFEECRDTCLKCLRLDPTWFKSRYYLACAALKLILQREAGAQPAKVLLEQARCNTTIMVAAGKTWDKFRKSAKTLYKEAKCVFAEVDVHQDLLLPNYNSVQPAIANKDHAVPSSSDPGGRVLVLLGKKHRVQIEAVGDSTLWVLGLGPYHTVVETDVVRHTVCAPGKYFRVEGMTITSKAEGNRCAPVCVSNSHLHMVNCIVESVP